MIFRNEEEALLQILLDNSPVDLLKSPELCDQIVSFSDALTQNYKENKEENLWNSNLNK